MGGGGNGGQFALIFGVSGRESTPFPLLEKNDLIGDVEGWNNYYFGFKSGPRVNISLFPLFFSFFFFSFFFTDPPRHGALFSRLNIVMQMGADGIVVRVERATVKLFS